MARIGQNWPEMETEILCFRCFNQDFGPFLTQIQADTEKYVATELRSRAADPHFRHELAFDHVAVGHGAVQHGRERMTGLRNYIEELTARVEAGKKAGQPLSEIQKRMPVASIKALQADGYGALARAGRDEAAMQAAVNTNIEHAFNRLGQS